jgi:hypothetical protein
MGDIISGCTLFLLTQKNELPYSQLEFNFNTDWISKVYDILTNTTCDVMTDDVCVQHAIAWLRYATVIYKHLPDKVDKALLKKIIQQTKDICVAVQIQVNINQSFLYDDFKISTLAFYSMIGAGTPFDTKNYYDELYRLNITISTFTIQYPNCYNGKQISNYKLKQLNVKYFIENHQNYEKNKIKFLRNYYLVNLLPVGGNMSLTQTEKQRFTEHFDNI